MLLLVLSVVLSLVSLQKGGPTIATIILFLPSIYTIGKISEDVREIKKNLNK